MPLERLKTAEHIELEGVFTHLASADVVDAPDVERFEYFVLNDQVVLVDPDTRIVVDMIKEPR